MNYLDNKLGSYWVLHWWNPLTAYALSQFSHINLFCKMCMLGWPIVKPIFNWMKGGAERSIRVHPVSLIGFVRD